MCRLTVEFFRIGFYGRSGGGGKGSSSTDPSSPQEALLQSTDYGLMVLGETVRGTIYQCLKGKYQLEREEIPEKLDAFHKALQGLLGVGAVVVERQIANKLYATLGLHFEARRDWTIVEYFEHAKKAKGGG